MSPASSEGNGAKIITNPDAPVNLQNDADSSTGTQIRFTWEEGTANGGSEVIDYSIYSAESAGTYALLASNVAALSYTAIDLTPGITYKFKVQSRNVYGFSADSAEVFILAAEEPA
jgi:hypothetical protein